MENITIDINKLGSYIDAFIIKTINIIYSIKIDSINEAKCFIKLQNDNYIDYNDRLFDVTTMLITKAKSNNFEEFTNFLICSTFIFSLFCIIDEENDRICFEIQNNTMETFEKFKNH